MNTSTGATLAKLDLASTMLCAHCAALLFGRVAYCPYCGEDGTRSWDGAARLAVAEADFALPEPTQAPIESIAWARPSVLDGTPVAATATATGRATGWSTGRITALAVCATAVALGAIHFYSLRVSDPRDRSTLAQASAAQPLLAVPEPASTPQAAPAIGVAAPKSADCSDVLAALALCGKTAVPDAAADASRVGSR